MKAETFADAAERILEGVPIEEKLEACEEALAGACERARRFENGLREALTIIDGIASTLPPNTRRSVLERASALRRL